MPTNAIWYMIYERLLVFNRRLRSTTNVIVASHGVPVLFRRDEAIEINAVHMICVSLDMA